MFKLKEVKVNYMIEPITISGKPSFSWCYENGSNSKQESYQIICSLEDGTILWDSKIINSNQMTNISYEGSSELPSRSVILVKVIVKSNNNEVDYFNTYFETTLKDNEWLGKWTSIPNNFNGGTLYFRKQFKLKNKEIKKARCYICGIGYHEFYLNGKKVGDKVLNPGVTNYDKTLLFDTYKIEEYLSKEDNVMGVEVGYGWYGDRKLLLELYIEYKDGEIYEDHSDCNHGWWVSGSPVLDNSIYGGEIYDARLEKKTYPNWTSLEFQPTWANGWMYTILTQIPSGKLTPQEVNPIKVLNEFKTKSKNIIDKTHIVYDLGQNMAGWVEIKVKGKEGSKVTLLYAEGIKEDGHVNQLNLRSARCSDAYILKGEGIEVYSPRFTYHGFQYVEAVLEGDVEVIEVTGKHVHSDIKVVGKFNCSNEILNKLHYMAVITEQNNQYSIMTDCPQRDERFGWLNDVSSRVFQSNYNFDIDRLYNKVVHDIYETQNEEGCIGDTAPYYTGGQPADTTTVSYLLLALSAYKYYGDDALVKKEYEGHKKWVEYLLTRQKDFIMDYYYYADWVPPMTLKNSVSDGIFVSSMFLYWHLITIAKLAKICGNCKDFEKYSSLAKMSKDALNKKYYHQEGYYCNNTQCENAMPVWLGICEDDNKELVVKHIVKDIIDNNYHITCGNQGYRHVFYLLAEYGYSDLAIKVLTNKEYPGWGYMVDSGATTVWERWEKEMQNEMHSFDHPMFGSYDAIFYHYFLGIQVDGNGASDITLHTYVPDSLDYANGEFKTIKGLIKVNWNKDFNNKLINYEYDVPTNTRAKLIVNKEIISLDGKKVQGNEFVLDGGKHILKTIL